MMKALGVLLPCVRTKLGRGYFNLLPKFAMEGRNIHTSTDKSFPFSLKMCESPATQMKLESIIYTSNVFTAKLAS